VLNAKQTKTMSGNVEEKHISIAILRTKGLYLTWALT